MSVSLQGPSVAALTAGILLLSRARSFGQPISVEVVGDPRTITPVPGPALVHCPVLASCGVGRELGFGSLLIVGGAPTEALAVSLAEDGTEGWFTVDRAGEGQHPATQAFVRLCRDPRREAREASRQLRRALVAVGCTSEPALLDLLFAAPVSPLVRLSLFLRAGAAMTGSRRVAITRFVSNRTEGPLLDRYAIGLRDGLEEWIETVRALDLSYSVLVDALFEIGTDLGELTPNAMLPPLDPAMDAVAVGLGAALGAAGGEDDANQTLADTFRFLGGHFVESARYPVTLQLEDAPEDRLERWSWICRAAVAATLAVEVTWRRIMDPVDS